MTREQWDNLKVGDVIYNETDGYMKVCYYDFYGTGEDEPALHSGKYIYPKSMFSHEDWEFAEKACN